MLHAQAVDVSAVLLSIHSYFEDLGVEEIRARGAREDKPLRMVKTILHELCKLLGRGIYSHTRGIPSAPPPAAAALGVPPSGAVPAGGKAPIIFPYIELNLQTLASGAAGASAAGRAAGAQAGAEGDR
jgi:cytoskeleton-associated protein 5